MALMYINDSKLKLVRQGKQGTTLSWCEVNTGDWIATVDSGGWLVYHKDSGTAQGTAYTRTIATHHTYSTTVIKERYETTFKAKPYVTAPTGTNSIQRATSAMTISGTTALGCGVYMKHTSGNVTSFELRASLALGTVVVTAGTEYIVHHVMDDVNGYHMMEVFNTSGGLVGRVATSIIAANSFAAVDDILIGAVKFQTPANKVIEHQLKHIYMTDMTSEFGQDWFGPDYNVHADQSFVDNNIEWKDVPAFGGTNQDRIDEWPVNTFDYNSSDFGDTNDREDLFDISAAAATGGTMEVKGVSIYARAEAHLPISEDYHIIDDGTNRLRGVLLYAGSGSAPDANEGICFSTAPGGGAWDNSEYNGMTVGYERFENSDALSWRHMVTVIVFYIEANSYGAAARSRLVHTSP